MAYRNDPSSLSFGARLSRAEQDAAQVKTELAELKQSLPNNRDLQAAAISGEAIKVPNMKLFNENALARTAT